jgi:hypothetical protein
LLFIPVRGILQPVRERAWGDRGKVASFDVAPGEYCLRLSAALVRREEVEKLFGFANLYASRVIELKCGNGGPADRCLTDDAVTVPTKMFILVA